MVDNIQPAQKALEAIMESMTPEEFAKRIEADPENPTLKAIQALFLSQPLDQIFNAAQNVEVGKLTKKVQKLADDVHRLNVDWKP